MRVEEVPASAGGWLVRVGGDLLLVDAPDGVGRAWRGGGLAAAGPDAVLVTAPGRAEGLFALLSAFRGRAAPLPLVCGMDDEVTPALAGAWAQTGARGYAPALISLAPGTPEVVGGLQVLPLPAGWLVASGEGAVVFAAPAASRAALARLGVDRVIWTGEGT